MVRKSFQKDKKLRLDELSIEFYLAGYDFIEEEMSGVIKYSTLNGRTLAPSNYDFLTLIPKLDSKDSFDKFLPISLYKIISKTISLHLKPILSESRNNLAF